MKLRLDRMCSDRSWPASGEEVAELRRRLASAEGALAEAEARHARVVGALGVAVYETDPQGRLTAYNDAAAALWGRRPTLGLTRWCGALHLSTPEGRPLPLHEGPTARALREGRPLHDTEALAERPDGTRVPFVAHATPLRDASGRITGCVTALVDISRRLEAEAALAQGEAQLRTLFETTPDCITLVAPDGTLLEVNRAGLRMVGDEDHEALEGRPVFGLVAAEDRAAFKARHDRICRGELLSWEFDIVTRAGRRLRLEAHAAPLRLPDGRIAHLSIARDISARAETQRQQHLLAREVDHRARNALAVALSLIRLTRGQDLAQFVKVLEGRVAALAHAHSLLSEGGWTGVRLSQLVERELLTLRPVGRVEMQGPDVMLQPLAVQAVSVVLHELATNAQRYGALSSPEGWLELAWTVDGVEGLRMSWVERGGPALAGPPEHRGFGLKLIDATVRDQLRGLVRPRWEPDGLRCDITIARDKLRV